MDTEQTNTTPTTDRPTSVPDFGMSFSDLAVEDAIFLSVEDAQEWLQQHGSSVLKEQALEVVKNLLSATSEERRSRGLLILSRAVIAQVAWLEYFQTWSSNGRFAQLKKATDAIRDADLSSEEHQLACASLVSNHQALLEMIEMDKVERQEAIVVIADLLTEKAFIESVEERQLLVDNRPKAKDAMWCVKALDLIVAGKEAQIRTATLVALAGNLQFHAGRFFGTGSTPNPKPSARTKSGQRGKNPLKLDANGNPVRRSTSAKEARKLSKR